MPSVLSKNNCVAQGKSIQLENCPHSLLLVFMWKRPVDSMVALERPYSNRTSRCVSWIKAIFLHHDVQVQYEIVAAKSTH